MNLLKNCPILDKIKITFDIHYIKYIHPSYSFDKELSFTTNTFNESLKLVSK